MTRSSGFAIVLMTWNPLFSLTLFSDSLMQLMTILYFRALEELDDSIFQGRLLHVMAAKPQKNDKAE